MNAERISKIVDECFKPLGIVQLLAGEQHDFDAHAPEGEGAIRVEAGLCSAIVNHMSMAFDVNVLMFFGSSKENIRIAR